MATVTVSASTTLALVTYSAGDDLSLSSGVTLTIDADPSAYPRIRRIFGADNRTSIVVTNPNTTFAAGSLWRIPFLNQGAALSTANPTLNVGSITVNGQMLICYTATGAASETVLTASNVLGIDIDFPEIIEVELTPGAGDWKSVPIQVVGSPGNGFLCTGSQSDYGTGDVGRVLFYDHAARTLKTGDGTNGSLFASGTRFRIPNVYWDMDPFTVTVAAPGWSTGTGSQPVSSSTNCPVSSGANVNAVAGGECFTITALGAGTVTTASRGAEGSTATAHEAGTVIYILPQTVDNSGSGVWPNSTSNYIGRTISLTNCWFGRWWKFGVNAAFFNLNRVGIYMPAFAAGASASTLGTQSSWTVSNSVMYGNLGRGLHPVFATGSLYGPFSFTDNLLIAHASASATQSATSSSINFFNLQARNVQALSGLRVWRMGFNSSLSNQSNGVALTGTSVATRTLANCEAVGVTYVMTNCSGFDFSGFRYSHTNGVANTAAANGGPLSINGGNSNLIFRDFDVMSGGRAPYTGFFNVANGNAGLIIHNKVGGSIKTIDGQSRIDRLTWFETTDSVLSHMRVSNMRAAGTTIISQATGNRNTFRALQWSDVAGAAFDSSSVIMEPNMTIDCIGGPLSGTSGLITQDVPALYGAAHTYATQAGGIWAGPFSPQNALALYDLTGGAYTSDDGQNRLYLETSGAVAVVKSAKAITGLTSISGAAVAYLSHVNFTTGVTAEFRLCKWGDDITAISWGSFTGGNVQTAFGALSGYSDSVGLNLQLRFTATTTSAGRYLTQLLIPGQMNASYNPAVGTVSINIAGASAAALAAVYYGPSDTFAGSVTLSGSGAGAVSVPYDFDGSSQDFEVRVRALEWSSVASAGTYGRDGSTAVVSQQALSGYVAGPYAGASFNKSTKVVTVSSAMTTQDLWSAWREYIVQLVNFDTDDDWTYPELNAGTWEVAFSGAGSITGSYTDVNGTRAPITAPNLPVGTRVQFYNFTDSVELTNEVLAGAGASTSLYFTTAKTIRLRASKLGSLPIEAFGVMTASGLTFIDEFVTDDVYVAKGIDGSTVTEFSADEPNVQIDSNDPDGTSSVWRCYAWFRYYETSSIGVAGVLFGAAQAIDTENLAIDSARADIQLDNVSAVPLKISDGYMYRTDGATIIAPTSGSIQMDPKKAYGVDNLLSAEIEPGFNFGRWARIVGAATAGKQVGTRANPVFRNIGDTADQITGTADANGGRTDIIYGS
jgi:hypothetical protein